MKLPRKIYYAWPVHLKHRGALLLQPKQEHPGQVRLWVRLAPKRPKKP